MSELDLSGYNATQGSPKGEFTLRICSAKMKDTKAGPKALNLEMAVVGPTHAKAKVFEQFNIHNESQKAQQIAREKLVNLLESLDMEKKIDTSNLTPLLNKLVNAVLVHDENGYSKVKLFKPTTAQVEAGEDF